MTEQRRLSAVEILSASDAVIVDVDVPEWGTVVSLRTLSAAEAMDFNDKIKKNDKEAPARLVILSAVDAEGQPLFSEKDLGALQRKSLKAILRLQKEAMKLNGLSEDADAVKNG